MCGKGTFSQIRSQMVTVLIMNKLITILHQKANGIVVTYIHKGKKQLLVSIIYFATEAEVYGKLIVFH